MAGIPLQLLRIPVTLRIGYILWQHTMGVFVTFIKMVEKLPRQPSERTQVHQAGGITLGSGGTVAILFMAIIPWLICITAPYPPPK